MSEIAVRVERLGKRFLIDHCKEGDLRRDFAQTVRRIANWKISPREEFWALNDVSFDIRRGEVVGIIGRNGAGKSTLLKLLSRITHPTTGRFEIDGRVSSLLEVGTGFHGELTGRENIFLNGTILGMRRTEIKRKFDEIVSFSGVEKFIDTPVKHYSSGMKVRLAFSVAAHLEPEILIVDEVLAVGDAEFQKKCLGKMDEVSKGEGRTILFVSHNMSAVEGLCSVGLFLREGRLELHDRMDSVIQKYVGSANPDAGSLADRPSEGSGIVKFVNAAIGVTSGSSDMQPFSFQGGVARVPFNCELKIDLFLRSEVVYKNKLFVAITIFNESGIKVTTLDNLFADKPFTFSGNTMKISCRLKKVSLNPGTYYCALWASDGFETIQKIEKAISFEVVANDYLGTAKSQSAIKHGVVYFDHEWTEM